MIGFIGRRLLWGVAAMLLVGCVAFGLTFLAPSDPARAIAGPNATAEAVALLLEASLTYLGAGVPPGTPTWGAMLVEGSDWWTADPRLPLLPGLGIAITVLGFMLLGDALRDALDPRGRGPI